MRGLELAVFLTLSGALHVAALSLSDLPDGGAGGAGGDSSVTLAALSPELAARVADWDRPPATSAAPELAGPPAEPPRDAPPAPRPEPPAPERRAALAPMAPPAPQGRAPVTETRLPAPPRLRDVTAPALRGIPAPPAARAAPSPPSTEPRVAVQRPDRIALAPPAAEAPPEVDRTPPRSHAPERSARPTARPAAAAARVSRETRPAQPAQKARGAGASRTSAARQPARTVPANGPDAGQLTRLQRQWGAGIHAAVARALRYPSGARGNGTVRVRIAVSPRGRVQSIRVLRSSGDPRLDRAAIAAVKSARLPRAPTGLTAASYPFDLPLAFARK